MKILLTGATGYLGKHLISSLIDIGIEKIYSINRGKSSHHQFINYIEDDLTNPAFTSNLPTEIDCIIYLAQSNQYKDFPAGASDMFLINVQAVSKLLNWGLECGIKSFIYASTGNVYKTATRLLTENDPTEAKSYYAASKICAETLISQYSNYFRTYTLRIFSIYGPGQQNMLIPGIIHKIRKQETIKLAQNCGIYLTPLFISDAVKMICQIISQNAQPNIYNLCGNTLVTLKSIVESVGNNLNIEPKIELTNNAVPWLAGDGSKLTKEINYIPIVDILTGLKLTINNN